MNKYELRVVGLLSALWLCWMPVALAATFYVASPQCQGARFLEEAIANANSNPGEDTISFAPDCADAD